jgi:hypothetical protein
VSSPRRKPAELAALLARKAGDDAVAVREFAGNPEISDEIVGFHAQQAVEKWLKALMAGRGWRNCAPMTSINSAERWKRTASRCRSLVHSSPS